ncbi:hypothetical protein HG531_004419 [Fusarium graminearum]|nr:hypothetical protein HG531_004419 [Fusarium graminearum]
MASVTVVVVILLLFGFLSLLAAFVDSLGIVIEDGSDDGDHVSLDNTSANIFCASNTNIDDALESKVPLPHSHHVLTTALFQNADKSLDTSIDGKNVADASRRCGEIGEMVERVDEGEGRGAIERTAII